MPIKINVENAVINIVPAAIVVRRTERYTFYDLLPVTVDFHCNICNMDVSASTPQIGCMVPNIPQGHRRIRYATKERVECPSCKRVYEAWVEGDLDALMVKVCRVTHVDGSTDFRLERKENE